MRSVISALAAIVSMIATVALAEDVESGAGCINARVLSERLITDVCWSCIFPIVVAGVDISGQGGIPAGAASNPLCSCDDGLGVPHAGVLTSMWEPARLIEFQRQSGCSSVLNGLQLPFSKLGQGTHANFETNGKTFTHYHYYAFPLLVMMDMFVRGKCIKDGYMDLDMLYISEVDPTWNDDELAFFTNPEAAAVANPVATAACSVDAVTTTTTGRPMNSMFWCAGAWGNLYPLSGHVTGAGGMIRHTSLSKSRVLAALHRRGLAWQTMGSDAMCEGLVQMTLPKSQYKFTMVHPKPHTNSDYVMGESTMKWGSGRKIPYAGEDPIYMIWRWNDCCNIQGHSSMND